MEENQNVIANDATGAENVTATSNDAILTELRDLSKKRLFYQKISTCCMAGMLAVLLICVLIVIPKVSTTLSHINSVATKAETSIESIDKMTDSILKASENMNKLVDDNGENLAAAVKSLSEIDFEGLNKAISDLQDAVGPMAAFMKKLGR